MKIPLVVWSAGAGLLLFIIIMSGLLFRHEACRDFSQGKLLIGSTSWSIALARTSVERSQGLAGCTQLPERSGLYFPYDMPSEAIIWMKGMRIPIDIVWIAAGTVIGIERHVPPVDKTAVDPPRYKSPRQVDGVLEIGAGEALRQNIKVGDSVIFQP